MKKLAFGLVSAAVLALTLPAAAQIGVRVGEDGIGVGVGVWAKPSATAISIDFKPGSSKQGSDSPGLLA
jgi:uncharacterized protein YdbL (DUF1318 family)